MEYATCYMRLYIAVGSAMRLDIAVSSIDILFLLYTQMHKNKSNYKIFEVFFMTGSSATRSRL